MQVTQRDLDTILNRRWRMEHLYKIKTEDARLTNLKFNDVQEELWAYCESKGHRGIEIIVDKARKEGVSTWWLIYYLDDTLWTPNTTTVILAHKEKDLRKLFKIVKLAYLHCPKSVKLESGKVWHRPEASYDNVNELTFTDINSTVYIALENRGDTPTNLHVSEAAHIKDVDTRLIPTIAAVSSNGRCNVSIESTANGVGDWFEETFHECEAGNGAYKPFFFGWWKKKLNYIEPPSDYQPGQEVLHKASLVKARYGVKLLPGQLFWWELNKKKLKRLMDQENPTVSEDSFLTAAGMVFDSEAMQKMVPRAPIARRPIKVETRGEDGKIITETFYADIYVEPKPVRRYVLGGDPSEGIGGDRSAIELIDTLTQEQVAELVSDKLKPAQFAVAVDNLARYYNKALAVIERNNHGHTVLDRLKDLYPNVFCMVVTDEKTNRRTKKMGWLTTGGPGGNRDLVLDTFEQVVADLSVKIYSAILKSEMLTFVTDEAGRREAKQGKHDDTILAFAIALRVARMPRTSFGVYGLN